MCGSDSHGEELVLYASNNRVRFPDCRLMKNFWLDIIDRALRCLGYMPDAINSLMPDEKEAIIIEEYLFILREDDEDCSPLSLEEMAEYIVDYKRGAI